MHRYLEAFFRHRLLLLLPVALALVASLGYEAVQPRQYEVIANLWFDGTGSVGATSQNPADPASVDAPAALAVLQELLKTKAFGLAVVRRGPLLAYITAHPDAQSGLAAVKGLGALARTPGSPEDRALAELDRELTVGSSGAQVVSVDVKGPTADVAAGTAKALIDQFNDELLASRVVKARVTVEYDQARVKAAQDNLASARASLTTYETDHRLSLTGPAPTDATGTELSHNAALAQDQYFAALDQYNQASFDVAHINDNPGFRIIDAPTAPASPIGFTKRLLLAGVAGLLVGILISLFGLLLLVFGDHSARRAIDLEKSLGLTVAGTIPRFESGRSRPFGDMQGWRADDTSLPTRPQPSAVGAHSR